MHVSAIVLAAGKGLRLGSDTPKPLVKIGGRPLIIYSLLVLSKHHDIKDIILVVNKYNKEEIRGEIKKNHLPKIKALVFGGRRRQDSVLRGLGAIDTVADLVLIHDGVRPFIDLKIVRAVIKAASKNGAAISGVPVKATIKKIRESSEHRFSQLRFVEETLDRQCLWEIQTPQVFRRDLIFKAYHRFSKVNVTDDAMLVEKLGVKISVVLGSYSNIKVTTNEDLIIAETMLKGLENGF